MACLTLAKERKYKGTFTQRLKLWKALKSLEGEDPKSKDPIEGLTIWTSVTRSSILTYDTLCYCLRNRNKIALYDSGTGQPAYTVWSAAPNEIFMEEG